jgi:hypothetical protein
MRAILTPFGQQLQYNPSALNEFIISDAFTDPILSDYHTSTASTTRRGIQKQEQKTNLQAVAESA